MKNIKLFEGYIDEKIKALRRLKVITRFIDKYGLQYFVIGDEYQGTYHFEYIEKMEDGDYIIEYIDYTQGEWKTGFKGKKYRSKNIKCGLTELPIKVIDALIAVSDGSTGNGSRLEIEYHLEMGQEPDDFIRIIKKYKEPINFTEWMFGMFIENEKQKEVNTYKFQNDLFTSHPEAFDIFMNEATDIRGDYEPLKLNPRIKVKFKKLWEEWNMKKQAKKYNL